MSREEQGTTEMRAAHAMLASLTRRKLVGSMAGVMAGFAATGRFSGMSAAPMPVAGSARFVAQELPEDAAPLEQQTLVLVNNATIPRVLDFWESVYERPADSAADLFSDPLVRLNRDFDVIPAAASSWSSDESGTVWTFTLRDDLVWNDGNSLTAHDFVKTFQYGADPEHAWDFTWYFDGVVKNWHEVITGEMPVEDLAVRVGENDYEFIIETAVTAPFLPAMLVFTCPLSKAALETHGPLYNVKPETHVSSGPFKLLEWIPDNRIVYVRNEDYKGDLQAPVQKVYIQLADPSTFWSLYQTDMLDISSPPTMDLLDTDPDLAAQAYSGVGDFRTFYLFFDVTTAPFDDLRVRQAISHVIDRDALISAILGRSATPAYSWLAPGFPASDREGLAPIQAFDVETAQQLLADAGYPNGEGFPKQVMWLRAEGQMGVNIATACSAMIKEHLNIDVEVSNRDQKLFTDSLNAKPTEIPFGFVSYGMDFLDPYNMLSLWKSGGRHSWSNPEFDEKLAAAASYLGDPAERIAMFQEVERILVEDVPAVFLYHPTPVQLIKPWVTGEFLAPDKNGITSLHWPSYAAHSTVPAELYIRNDAVNRP